LNAIVATPDFLPMGTQQEAMAALSAMARNVESGFTVEPRDAGPNAFEFNVDYPQAAGLGFAQSAYGGWTARIDGEDAPLGRMNGAFLMTYVPAGRHEVRFEFYPEGLALGRMLSLAALAVLVYGLGRGVVLRRRGMSAASAD
jgi:hypothetical protein